MNFSAFHSTYEVDTPLCSARDLEQYYQVAISHLFTDQFNSIQFNSLIHFTQGNTNYTVFQFIYIINKLYMQFVMFSFILFMISFTTLCVSCENREGISYQPCSTLMFHNHFHQRGRSYLLLAFGLCLLEVFFYSLEIYFFCS